MRHWHTCVDPERSIKAGTSANMKLDPILFVNICCFSAAMKVHPRLADGGNFVHQLRPLLPPMNFVFIPVVLFKDRSVPGVQLQIAFVRMCRCCWDVANDWLDVSCYWGSSSSFIYGFFTDRVHISFLYQYLFIWIFVCCCWQTKQYTAG